MPLLTSGEACQVLRVTPETLRAMLRRGELEGFQVGRLTRITRESVERLSGFRVPELVTPPGHVG
jgi:excisionase family DNA binding protein